MGGGEGTCIAQMYHRAMAEGVMGMVEEEMGESGALLEENVVRIVLRIEKEDEVERRKEGKEDENE